MLALNGTSRAPSIVTVLREGGPRDEGVGEGNHARPLWDCTLNPKP